MSRLPSLGRPAGGALLCAALLLAGPLAARGDTPLPPMVY